MTPLLHSCVILCYIVAYVNARRIFLIGYVTCMVLIYIVANIPIQRRAIVTDVTRTVPLSKSTS
jgi:hypothetical protein